MIFMKKFLYSLVILSFILTMATPIFAFDSNLWPAGGETVVIRENDTATVSGVFEKSGTWTTRSTFTYLDGSGGMKTSAKAHISSTTAGSYVKYYLGTFTPGNYYAWFYSPNGVLTNAFNYEIGSSTAGVYASGIVNQTSTLEWLLFTDTVRSIAFSGDGSEYIKLSVNGTADLRTGVVKLTKPANEYVIDINDSAFSKSGSWTAAGTYSSKGLVPITGWRVQNSSASYAKYDFKGIIPTGNYDVYFYNPEVLANTANANFHVYNSSGTDQIFPFTTWATRAWVKVNDTPIAFNNPANEAYVQVQGASSGYTRIGAIKLVKISQVELVEMLSAPGYTDGIFSVTTNGTSLSGDINAVMVVAEYNNNALTNVISKPISITKGNGNKQETIPMIAKGTGYTYKLMVLDSLAKLKPLMTYYPYPT